MSSSGASDGADTLATIPVICGPTASGKSSVAMWLSQRREIVIISADSRQIYRGFDVGTAKPSRADRDKVTHRGVDVAEATQRYSAAEWVAMAQRAIADALSAGRLPVVVGGTGFYIGALVRPLWAEPPLDPARRAEIQDALAGESTEELKRWCVALDPARAHLGRTQLLRAIEVALLTGRRMSEMHASNARPSAYRASYLLVDPGAELQARIASRAAGMLDAGWVDEVEGLMKTVPDDAPAWNATGYGAVRDLIRGTLNREDAYNRVLVESRQYAKRQRTWFRHQIEPDRLQRMSPGASGWQEVVERWVNGVEESLRT